MTDLHSRLLAELMKPDCYRIPPDNAADARLAVILNAQGRLAAILRMLAEVVRGEACEAAGDSYMTDGNAKFWDKDSIYGAARDDAAKRILSILPE